MTKMRALLLGGLACSAAVGWWLLTVAGVGGTLGQRSPAEAQDRPAATGGSLPARAIAVEVATARAVRTSTDIRAIGSLQSDETVQLAPEIAGRVSEIDFVEGTPVKSGDILVRLDDALAKAEVKDAQARLSFAEANNERARQLSRTGNVTERSVDEAATNLETARAAVELAATRLDKHLLRAPFDGIAGVRKVSVGAFVAVGTPVVNIEKIDKLKVDFKVPEIHLSAVSPGQIVDVTVDAIPGKVFEGKIYAINPQVDVNGRALQARALIDNTDLLLRPGLFARILIKGAVQRDAVVVPESAILPRAGDNFVFRVEQGVARQVRVKLGERRAGLVEIAEGLAPGDVVVTAGQHKLRDGTAAESVATHPQGDVSDSDQDKATRSGG